MASHWLLSQVGPCSLGSFPKLGEQRKAKQPRTWPWGSYRSRVSRVCWPYTHFFGSFIEVEMTPIQFVRLRYTALLCSVVYSCNRSARERRPEDSKLMSCTRWGDSLERKTKSKWSAQRSSSSVALRCVPISTVNSRASSFPQETPLAALWPGDHCVFCPHCGFTCHECFLLGSFCMCVSEHSSCTVPHGSHCVLLLMVHAVCCCSQWVLGFVFTLGLL